MKPKIFIGLPIHRYWAHESNDYFNQCLDYAQNWDLHTLFKLYEESLIQRARNTILEKFLESNADFLFFLDDDIVLIEPNSIDLLVAADKDIIGAPCVCKKPPYRPNFFPFQEQYPDLRGHKDPFKIKYLGTSCMLIKREVAQRVKKHFKYPFDCFENKDGIYLSEDWAFCDRAYRLGYECFVHPLIPAGHLGIYAFSMSDYYAFKESEVKK